MKQLSWAWLLLVRVKYARSYFAAVVVLLSTATHASLADEDFCTSPKTAAEILACVRVRHPEVQRAKLGKDQSEVLGKIAAQIPNPEFAVEPAIGNTQGQARRDIELSLLQPIELGGKRTARHHEAQARLRHAEVDLTLAQIEVTLQTVVKLQRMRQLQQERRTFEDGIGIFSKLISQYRAKPRLPPEQEVSLAVFRMAKADYELRRTALSEEERMIETFFRTAAGYGLANLKNALPALPEKWPEVQDHAAAANSSPQALRKLAAQDLADAELEAARGASWPDMRVGPKVQLEKDGGHSSQLYGLGLSIALPVWNRNAAGREYADRGLRSAQKGLELSRVEDSEERAELVRIYRGAVQALRESLSLSDVQKSLEGTKRHFLQGLVPSSLVVEAHRQLGELQKSRHEREMRAIDSLWHIYALDGQILKETL